MARKYVWVARPHIRRVRTSSGTRYTTVKGGFRRRRLW
jgi:hypothetical protein